MSLLEVHIAAVECLAAHGVKPPREWVAVRDRYREFSALAAPATERLIAEILGPPTGADLALLRAAALAEHHHSAAWDTHEAVARGVHARLSELYRPRAVANYQASAAEFDAVTEAGAGRLDELLWPLAAAAELAGVAGASKLDEAGEALRIALTCEPGTAAPHRIWAAWRSAARWPALVAAGARIRAHPEPADVTPYPER